MGVLNSTKRSRLAKGASGLLTLSTILESQLRVVVVAERTVSGLLLLWLRHDVDDVIVIASVNLLYPSQPRRKARLPLITPTHALV